MPWKWKTIQRIAAWNCWLQYKPLLKQWPLRKKNIQNIVFGLPGCWSYIYNKIHTYHDIPTSSILDPPTCGTPTVRWSSLGSIMAFVTANWSWRGPKSTHCSCLQRDRCFILHFHLKGDDHTSGASLKFDATFLQWQHFQQTNGLPQGVLVGNVCSVTALKGGEM